MNKVQISTHLLETNRVCFQNPLETNFHIFYILVYGSPDGIKQILKLKNDKFVVIHLLKPKQLRLIVKFQNISTQIVLVRWISIEKRFWTKIRRCWSNFICMWNGFWWETRCVQAIGSYFASRKHWIFWRWKSRLSNHKLHWVILTECIRIAMFAFRGTKEKPFNSLVWVDRK